jgi:hypothetical protein
VVLAFAVDATPDELVAGVGTACPAGDVAGNLASVWAARQHVLSTKRVVIRGVEAPDAPNHNPSLAGISAGSVALDPDGATTLALGVLELAPVAAAGPAGAPELYTKRDATGVAIETAPEEWVYSWFSTGGELEELETRSGQLDRWTVPAGARGPVQVAVVARDLRGGTAWSVREVVFAP